MTADEIIMLPRNDYAPDVHVMDDMNTAANLIETQQKEIERLKSELAESQRREKAAVANMKDYITQVLDPDRGNYACRFCKNAIKDNDCTIKECDGLNHWKWRGGKAEGVDSAPTADTERHARWENDRMTIKCNNCGFGTYRKGYFFMNGECFSTYFIPSFCPNCGAKMDEEKQGEQT